MRVLRAGSVPAMLAAAAVAVGTAGSWAPGPPSGRLLAAEAAQPPASSQSVRGLLDRYCVSCHNEGRVGAVGGSASVLDAQLRATGLALDTVDAERPVADAERAGGTIVKPAQDVFWGGHSGYFRDPDGHLWEVAWNPGSPLDGAGNFAW